MVTPFDEHGHALLMHLEEHGPGEINDVLARRGLGDDDAFQLAEYLGEQGLVTNSFSGGGAIESTLTGGGRQRAQRLLASRPARRLTELRRRMLAWLEHHGQNIDWNNFLASDQVQYEDAVFTEDEVTREAEYLDESGLITSLPVDEAPNGTIQPQLTARGRDCLLYHGGDVRRLLTGRSDEDSMTDDDGINRQGIQGLFAGIQAEFDKQGPIRVPVETGLPTLGTTVNYNGPVLQGDMTHAQIAWNAQHITQNQQHNTSPVAPGYEELARLITDLLQSLPAVGLPDQDRADAEEAAQEALAEITQPEPEKSKLRKCLNVLKGVFAPLAAGYSAGATETATEWSKTALEALSGVVV
ncbi:hypothetical protein L3Q67_45355 (plasmid) [Saccharothrix sp. AJ9571]|nr:hypothetical protein L3Q67_45355 [Saccharothrix sp. AJ9571]